MSALKTWFGGGGGGGGMWGDGKREEGERRVVGERVEARVQAGVAVDWIGAD